MCVCVCVCVCVGGGGERGGTGRGAENVEGRGEGEGRLVYVKDGKQKASMDNEKSSLPSEYVPVGLKVMIEIRRSEINAIFATMKFRTLHLNGT